MEKLENFGVLEMNAKEMKEAEGGIIFCLFFGVSALCLMGPMLFASHPAY